MHCLGSRLTQLNQHQYLTENIYLFLHRNPNEGPHLIPTEWPEFTEKEREYMLIGPEAEATTQNGELLGHLDFWNNYFTEIAIPRQRWPSATENNSKTGKDQFHIILKFI